MATPFTRVSTISDAQRHLMDRGARLGVVGRTHAGSIDHPAGRPGHGRRPDGDPDDENFNPDGSRKERRERKPEFKVELLCRTFAGDAGLRPLPSMVFWESPDIVIEGPSGDPDVATPGVNNKVKVHIWNLGLADCWSAHVDLYWCDPSVGITPSVANAIGSKVIPIASGQHSIVTFDWTPVLLNGGHECLVVQVYDPVADPLVAPFNPVQDRHVGQRNVSVVQLAANQTLNFNVFSQNLSFTTSESVIELQKIEGEALKVLALSMGRDGWEVAGGTEVQLTRPALVHPAPHAHARELITGTFREALQQVPGMSERRRVMGVMRELSATAQDRAVEPIAARETIDERIDDPSDALETDTAAGKDSRGMRVRLPAGRHVRMSLRASLPATAKRGSADVWRVVEHAGGRITGGVTIILQAK